MKRARLLLLALSLLPWLALPAPAQQSSTASDEPEFFAWMETVSQLNGKLGYYLKEKDSAESAKAAQEMHETLAKVAGFFESRKASAAAKFARDAEAGFRETRSLAEAGKMPEALQKYYDSRGHCEGCHSGHRVRGADGNWQIKY